MTEVTETRRFLDQHLQAIFAGDIETYHNTTVADLTIYEWFVTPHRIDGLPFHDFMLAEAARVDSAAIGLDPRPQSGQPAKKPRLRFDLANYREQSYGETVICSYTMLLSSADASGVAVKSYNESRVLVRLNGEWKVVHVHKSPSWRAPFQPPG